MSQAQHTDSEFFTGEECTAQWQAFYIEPIPYSGERITAGLLFKTEEGEVKAINTLPIEALTCLYQDDAKTLYTLASSVLDESKNALVENDFTVLKGLFDGVYFGEVFTSVGDNLDEIVQSAIISTASLQVNADAEKKKNEPSSQWLNEVQKSTLEIKPSLEKNFRKKTSLWGDHGKSIIGYVGNELAINFITLNPQSSIDKGTKDILMLQRFKKHNAISEVTYHHLELSIKIPNWKDYGSKQKTSLENKLFQLEQLADDVRVISKHYSDTKGVVKTIVNDASLA